MIKTLDRPLSKTRVMIVDDSFFMRATIQRMLESDPTIEVVGVAHNGKEALDKLGELKPDVVTLDIEMPVMDGLSTLKVIMETNPLPVIMLSSLTEEGAEHTIQALELGAIDFLPKKIQKGNLQIQEIRDILIQKVKTCAKVKRLRKGQKIDQASVRQVRPVSGAGKNHIQVVAIGVSTGGPKALQDVIPYLPEGFPVGVLIVQHMPKTFTGAFAKRLDGISNLSVKEAQAGEEVLPGKVLIAPGDKHLIVQKSAVGRAVVKLSRKPSDALHCPSVDVLMHSIAEVYKDRALAVMMTGMGKDGCEGMKAIKEEKGKILAQDKESCVVYGMPKSVVEMGIVDKVVNLSCLAETITKWILESKS